MDRVVLIADAGEDAGLGHLSRTSALGAALQRRGASVDAFALGLRGATTERYGVAWRPTGDGSYHGAKAIVLDSYQADHAFRASLRGLAPLVVFSDFDTPSDDVDLCIGLGDLGASPCLSGPGYACLGPPYWEPVAGEPSPEVRRVLVATGAGDVTDLGTELAAKLRDALPGALVALLRGPAATQVAPEGVELVSSPPTLYPELKRADLVICAAGQTMLKRSL